VFTAQRVSEVVGATWSEFDLEDGVWRIPRERMKQKDEERGLHEIPLPTVLLATLQEWKAADRKEQDVVCMAPRDAERSVTPEGVEKYYREALGLVGRHSPHSWRSAFSTIAREAGKDADVIEAQLDHVVGNKVASAYDRAKRFELRRSLLRWYEGQLIAARDGAAVMDLKRKA
jgi:integrase